MAGGGGGGRRRLVAAGGDNKCGSCEGGLIFYDSGAVKKRWLASKNGEYLLNYFKRTSTGFRQNMGTPTGRLCKFLGLFPYYVK